LIQNPNEVTSYDNALKLEVPVLVSSPCSSLSVCASCEPKIVSAFWVCRHLANALIVITIGIGPSALESELLSMSLVCYYVSVVVDLFNTCFVRCPYLFLWLRRHRFVYMSHDSMTMNRMTDFDPLPPRLQTQWQSKSKSIYSSLGVGVIFFCFADAHITIISILYKLHVVKS